MFRQHYKRYHFESSSNIHIPESDLGEQGLPITASMRNDGLNFSCQKLNTKEHKILHLGANLLEVMLFIDNLLCQSCFDQAAINSLIPTAAENIYKK